MEKKNLERGNRGRRANDARVNREPTDNLRLIKKNEQGLNRGDPIRRNRGQTCLGPCSVVATALLAELRRRERRMEV